jgi:putative aldouronate transport system substrate-binding protein
MATTFKFNKETVEDECANFNAVCDEYLKPLQYGLVEDVEAGLNEFMKQAKIAGLEDIWDEYIKQYNAWLAQQ